MRVKYVGYDRAYAYCPYHKDKRPSAAINLEGEYTGHWYCFSCGRSGVVGEAAMEAIMARRKTRRSKPSDVDWRALTDQYLLENYPQWLEDKWNVSWAILDDMLIGSDSEAATIPMWNEAGQIIGIQRQFPDGFKCAVDGSSNGLFRSWYILDGGTLHVCEGASDTAVMLDMGFNTIGRANNNSCNELVCAFVKAHMIRRVTVIADNDKPGIMGAKRLRGMLSEEDIPSNMLIPPFKDVREAVKERGKEEMVQWLKEGQ